MKQEKFNNAKFKRHIILDNKKKIVVRLILIVMLFFVVYLWITSASNKVFATNSSQDSSTSSTTSETQSETTSDEVSKRNEIEKNLIDAANDLLSGLDLSQIESEFTDFDFFKGKGGAEDRIIDLINGDYNVDTENMINYALNSVFGGVKELLPELSIILAIALFVGITESFKPAVFDKSVFELTFYISLTLVLGIASARFVTVYQACEQSIKTVDKQSEIIFPILLTLMTVAGGSVSVAVFKPQTAFLVNLTSKIVQNILLPMVFIMFVMNLAGSVSKRFKLDKATAFLKSLFKWITGITVLLFNFFVTAQGLTTSIYDSVSLKALKYALGNSMPFVSGLVGNGFDVVFASCLLIKNAVGSFALLGILFTVLSPIIKIAVFSLFMKLIAACIEPIADKRLSEVMSKVSGLSGFLVASVCVSSSSYFVTVLLMMTSLGSVI